MPIKDITIELVEIEQGIQPRVRLNQETVDEYEQAWREGIELPPLVVFYDGTTYRLAEGFHRYFGAKAADLECVPCDVRKGTYQDARDHAAGSNATHGLKRTNADKRKAVGMMLEDHPDWANARIAKHCQVGDMLVADVREELQPPENEVETPQVREGADGKKRKVPKKPKPEPVETEEVTKEEEPESAVSAPQPPVEPAKKPAETNLELKELNDLLTLLKKAARMAADINADLYPSSHYQNVHDALDTACIAATEWKKGAKR